MLVSAKEMLTKAKEGHYAVGQFNINNLEWTKAILLTAEELKSPVILGVSEGAGKYMCGFKTVADMVKSMINELNITVPVALHLDHGTYEACYKCIDAGFSSIMFDGSHYAIEENVAKTKELVAVCEEKGLSLEAEVGSIGGEEDGVVGMGECADPDECKMIADLGVTMLAAGIGNIHGKYPANWAGLSFETLAAISEKVGKMPLVLHGGTYSQTVLAYKSGSEISGVGGWAGTASKSKDLQFVTFTANGDNWTLEDCGYHYVYSDGNLSERTRVNACEIYGVI